MSFDESLVKVSNVFDEKNHKNLSKIEVFSSQKKSNKYSSNKKENRFQVLLGIGVFGDLFLILILFIFFSFICLINILEDSEKKEIAPFILKLDEKARFFETNSVMYDGELVQRTLSYKSPDSLYSYTKTVNAVRDKENLTIHGDGFDINVNNDDINVKTNSCDTVCDYFIRDSASNFTKNKNIYYLNNSLRGLPLYGKGYGELGELKLVEYKDGIEHKVYDMPKINSENMSVYLHRKKIEDWNDSLYKWIKDENK